MTDLYVLPEVCVGLGGLIIVWRFGFETQRRDDFRCEIRHLRDHLFDFMWQHGRDYSDPAYQETRTYLNSLIYLGGALSPVSIIVASVLALRRLRQGRPTKPPRRSADAMLQQEIERVKEQALNTFLMFLFGQGFFGILIRILYICSQAVHAAQKTKDFILAGTDYVIYNANAIAIQNSMLLHSI